MNDSEKIFKLEKDIQYLQHELILTKQNVDYLKTIYGQLLGSHISLSAEVTGIKGLVMKVAQDSGMDTDTLLDEMKVAGEKKKKELYQFIKENDPDIYHQLPGA